MQRRSSPTCAELIRRLGGRSPLLLAVSAPAAAGAPTFAGRSGLWHHRVAPERERRVDLAHLLETCTVEPGEGHGLALTGIRGAKTNAKASQKTPVLGATIAGPAETIRLLESAAVDLRAVGRIAELSFDEAETLEVRDVELEPAQEGGMR